jgi:hypothetical protein
MSRELRWRNYTPYDHSLGAPQATDDTTSQPYDDQEPASVAVNSAPVSSEDSTRSLYGFGFLLTNLMPKKVNADLKRDLAAKLKMLDKRTQEAIRRLASSSSQ